MSIYKATVTKRLVSFHRLTERATQAADLKAILRPFPYALMGGCPPNRKGDPPSLPWGGCAPRESHNPPEVQNKTALVTATDPLLCLAFSWH